MTEMQKYEGRVIAFREDNGYYDSDFYALVETDEGGFAWIGTGSTAYGGGWIATPNATAEVQARYAAWYAAKYERAQAEQAAYEETLVKVGSTVYVRGGRKYQGKTGTVTWYGEDRFKSTKQSTHYRARVQTASGESFYVPASYLWVQTSTGEFVEAAETMRVAGAAWRPQGCSAAMFALSAYPAPKQEVAA